MSGSKTILSAILTVAFAARILYVFFYVDLAQPMYNEYSEIAKYLVAGKGYSFISDKDGTKHYHYDHTASPAPSAYMMPGYVLFLAAILNIAGEHHLNLIVLIVQAIFSLLVIWMLYRWMKEWTDNSVAFLAATIYALTPEFIVADMSYSVVVFVHLAFVSLAYGLQSRSNTKDRILLCAASSVAMIILRAEALMFLSPLACSLAWRRRYKLAFSIVGGTIVALSLWSARNYSVFGEFVPLTTTSGLNLYRGHNPYRIGVWSDDSLATTLNSFAVTPKLELRMDSTYKGEAWKAIQYNGWSECSLALNKIYNYMIADWADQRTHSILYIVPWLLLMLTALWAVVLCIKGELKVPDSIPLFILSGAIACIIFFCLPRYQTMMKIAIIPLASIGAQSIYLNIRKPKGVVN